MEELDLHVTNRCNLRCIHCCFNSGRQAMSELSTRELVGVLDEAIALGAREIHVTGGEPFLRKDIFTILEAARAKGANIRIQTNGTLLDRGVLAELAALGIDELMISLDGPEEVNDRIRGGGTYRQAWDAVCAVRELGIPLRVNTVVMKSNLASIAGFLGQTVDLGVKTHSFFHFTPVGAGSQLPHEAVPKQEWLGFLAEMGAVCRRRDVRQTRVVLEQVYVDSAEIRETDTLGCRIGFKKYCQVLCDGSVSPCTFLLYTGLFLGNVTRDSLSDVWNDSNRWEQYDAHMAVCRPCERFDVCKGGCWLYSYYHSGTFDRDPRCDGSDSVIPICPYLKRSAHGGVIVHSTADASGGKGDLAVDGLDA